MARIRTIKPDFFRHEALQDLEIDNPGAYPMLVFSGLWAVSDREGRFEWRPRRIKLDVLPFLNYDMENTLSLLVEAGLVEKYDCDGSMYGAIVSWDRHQIVGRDEPPSEIPAPDGSKTLYFRPLNQTQRLKVYERDNWTCVYCGRNMRNDRRVACLDHVIPYSKGGTNREMNLATSCKKCNSEKSDKTPSEAGFNWPVGLGEYLDKDTNTVRQHTVNTPLTGGLEVADKEWERNGKGREEEGKGKGNTANPPSSCDEVDAAVEEKPDMQEPTYFTKKGRKLSGEKLAAFSEFWEAFDFKKGKPDAADSWLDIRGMNGELLVEIVAAAKNEASGRAKLLARNGSPKWAQGWLSSRRWEDEDCGAAYVETPYSGPNNIFAGGF